jgi:hypothetical protein
LNGPWLTARKHDRKEKKGEKKDMKERGVGTVKMLYFIIIF